MGPGIFLKSIILNDACIPVLHLATLLFGTLVASAQSPQTTDKHLPVLAAVRAIHDLPAEKARLAYPVHVRATVTYYDSHNDGRHASLFVHDATAGIFVLIAADMQWPGEAPHAGSLVDIVGVSAPGDYAALITQCRIRVIGESHTTFVAKPVSFTHLSSGVEDAQFVETDGVVRSVVESARRVTLNITMADGVIGAVTVKQPGVDYRDLVDATVRVQGSVGTLFNENRQMIGAHLMFAKRSSVQVIQPPPADVFGLPVRPIDRLSRFAAAALLPHRIHVRGTVTLYWPGQLVCIQDVTQGICAQSSQSTSLGLGEVIDVAGFVASGGYKPGLVDASFRPRPAQELVTGSKVTAADALQGDHDAGLITIEGRLIGRDLTSKQPTLLLAAGDVMFPAILPEGTTSATVRDLEVGSKVSVTGICRVVLDAQGMASGSGVAVTKSFHVLTRSESDVVVLETPSWWNVAHTLLALGTATAITFVVIGWVVVLRKRVEHQTKIIRESEERFHHMAQHDGLTGLPTRGVLHERLRIALQKLHHSGTGLALLMLDLDDFKHVNDTLGHDGGDETLRVMSRRIQETIRLTDLVARMGGDEFIILLEDLSEAKQAEAVAAKIVTALSVPIPIRHQEVPVSVSVGVCAIFDGSVDPEALLKSVDLAMYQAKEQGRNRFKVFSDEMAATTFAKQRMKEGLAHALERQELELFYQPIVSCESDELTGFEALLRWNSKELGRVMPGDFITLAESSGMIVSIGEWVIRQACMQIGQLERELERQFTLAVNLSPRQLLQKELPESIRRILEDFGRPAHRLKMEITENILMADSLSYQETIVQIRNLGVQLAIDDFGTGFSSLSYISRFPVNWIKIDRSFIAKCATDQASLAVVRAIIAMAHSLNIRVIAEGVETYEQLLVVKQEDADSIQGYYYSRPTAYEDLRTLVETLCARRRGGTQGALIESAGTFIESHAPGV